MEAVAAGSDYTYEELLACLTGAGCTEAEALAYAGEPVEAPEGATVRYSLLRVEDYDGTEDLPVRCLVLAALEYAPGEPVPRSILALRSPMALTVDGSAFEGQVFAALYSGRNFTCIVSGNSLPEEDTLWTGTDWIGIDENGEGYALGGRTYPRFPGPGRGGRESGSCHIGELFRTGLPLLPRPGSLNPLRIRIKKEPAAAPFFVDIFSGNPPERRQRRGRFPPLA